MAFIRNIFAAIITIAIIAFVLMNRQITDVTWSPLHDPYQIPLYGVILGSLLTGFLIGAFAVWFNDGKLRRTKREQKRQIKSLQKEVDKAHSKPVSQTLPDDFFPALPHKSAK